MVRTGLFQFFRFLWNPRSSVQWVGLFLALSASAVLAQAPSPETTPARVVASGPAWHTLTPAQHLALAPLASTWSSLTEGQRRKWIALAPTFATLTAGEQEKMHGRMAQWAALSPKERAVARLNFEQTRKLTPEDRTAKWEAYQALPAEERQRLASEPARKPVGAAVAVRPIPASRLAEVPAPRHSQDSKGSLLKNPEVLDRKTLLPKAPVASSPASPAPPAVAPPVSASSDAVKP